jgi:aconitate hydratase
VFTELLTLDLGDVVPSLAGPKRPEGRVALPTVASLFDDALTVEYKKPTDHNARFPVEGRKEDLGHGDVVIAAITSCTNTSNPSVLIAAGLLARKALQRVKAKPWVKTSLAPGSQVVAGYLADSACRRISTRSASTSSVSAAPPASAIPVRCRKRFRSRSTTTASSPQPCFRATATSKAASPRRAGELSRLAAAGCRHALAGTVTKNLDIEPIGTGKDGKPVYLKDIWPTAKEINAFIKKYVTSTIFKKKYADVFKGDTNWRKIKTVASDTYVEHELDLRAEPAVLRRHEDGAGAHDRYRGSASLRCSATRSPPTTSRRPVRSS